MNAKDIQQILIEEYYPKGRKIQMTNYSGSGFHEADVFQINPNTGTMWEYEVKISRSDFRADKKKVHKHSRMQNPPEIGWAGTNGVPTHFYYAAPTGVIPIEEVPIYAGLVEIDEEGYITTVKKAPKLHKIKASEQLINSIAQALTARMVYGSSYMRYQQKKREEILNNNI